MPIESANSIAPQYDPSGSETYDDWLQRHSDEAAREANDPNTVWVPHEQVMKELDALQEKWQASKEKRQDIA
jgi:hypothetical protein